jgi:hypothetical protein
LEDGTAIGEVPAIWRYLEEVYPMRCRQGNKGATIITKAVAGVLAEFFAAER